MKRRRIREIVAAAVDARTRQRTNPREVTIDVEVSRNFLTTRVTIDVGPYREGVHCGSTKVGALVAVLRWYVPGDWKWPPRSRDERERAGRGMSLDVLAQRPAPHPYIKAVELRLGVLGHLREPVALPEEASRG